MPHLHRLQRPRARRAGSLLRLVLGLGPLLLAPPGAGAEDTAIFKWVDENGVAHYTTDRDRIPASIRERVVESSGAGTSDWLNQDAGSSPARPATPVAAPGTSGSAATATAGTAGAATASEAAAGGYVEPTPQAPGALPPGEELPPAVAKSPDAPRARRPEPEAEPEAAVAPVAAPASASEPSDDVASPPPPEEPATPIAEAAPLDPGAAREVAELDRKIAALESEIAADEQTLMELISSDDAQQRASIVDDPTFREISQRLPRRQAELETLRERRFRIEPSAPATP